MAEEKSTGGKTLKHNWAFGSHGGKHYPAVDELLQANSDWRLFLLRTTSIQLELSGGVKSNFYSIAASDMSQSILSSHSQVTQKVDTGNNITCITKIQVMKHRLYMVLASRYYKIVFLQTGSL